MKIYITNITFSDNILTRIILHITYKTQLKILDRYSNQKLRQWKQKHFFYYVSLHISSTWNFIIVSSIFTHDNVMQIICSQGLTNYYVTEENLGESITTTTIITTIIKTGFKLDAGKEPQSELLSKYVQASLVICNLFSRYFNSLIRLLTFSAQRILKF